MVPHIKPIRLSEEGYPILEWEAVKDADMVQILRSKDDQDEFTDISTSKRNNYTDKTVEKGQSYFYKIRAKYSDRSWSEFSEVVSITIPEGYISSGDVLFLGTWEQNNKSMGKEAIEWQVLTLVDGKALLISRYCLDCRPFHDDRHEAVTWEKSSLRSWLNSTFYDNAFSGEEKERILAITVGADKNPSFGTDPGGITTDKVFLLSAVEAGRYFASDPERHALRRGIQKVRADIRLMARICAAGGGFVRREIQ